MAEIAQHIREWYVDEFPEEERDEWDVYDDDIQDVRVVGEDLIYLAEALVDDEPRSPRGIDGALSSLYKVYAAITKFNPYDEVPVWQESVLDALDNTSLEDYVTAQVKEKALDKLMANGEEVNLLAQSLAPALGDLVVRHVEDVGADLREIGLQQSFRTSFSEELRKQSGSYVKTQ